MSDAELVAALIIAIAGLIAQYFKSRDSDKHGDAFLKMLKDGEQVINTIVTMYPTLKPFAEQYNAVINTADELWNSRNFTASQMQDIAAKAEEIKKGLSAALVMRKK